MTLGYGQLSASLINKPVNRPKKACRELLEYYLERWMNT
ncbi:unnamed protein product [Chondrus crispus]|uniref:Uncharacterized protein n=1 Tax=Chondrus crispus TaxID=2769 RepID=R7QEL4_CHOCR|nr:unnamed protein product [Chondrus crispus]CDF36484.1 unnamed protein product [Chondrus crispus]|eukprot:XP_005716303.1 unnamed protein product [Chondrus crispus]